MEHKFLGQSQITSRKELFWVAMCSIAYLVLSTLLVGYKSDQLFLVCLFNVLYFLSPSTRRFILGFFIFIVFWIIFDYMKAIPNYWVNDIHIKDLYTTEKSLFGIMDNGTVLTPNEYADKHTSTLLDVATGFFYINWMPVPLLFALYLFGKDKMIFLQFALSFLFVNLVGFIVYYLFPAAPPWYVKEYGFEIHYQTPGNTAGLARFDTYFGVHLFSALYAKSSNVFAAMPSLHSAYPVVVLFYGLKRQLGWINVFFFIFMTGIWFSAVYSGHHYVMDVIAGVLCAVTGLFIFQKILLRQARFRNFLLRYRAAISSH